MDNLDFRFWKDNVQGHLGSLFAKIFDIDLLGNKWGQYPQQVPQKYLPVSTVVLLV